MSARVLRFPTPAHAATGGASRWAIARTRLRLALARAAVRLGIPGAVRPVVVEDSATGQRLEITVGPLYTRIAVNGREYFFDQFTGRFDGTGGSC